MIDTLNLTSLAAFQAARLSRCKQSALTNSINQINIMTYIKQSALSNCILLASKIGRVLDVDYISSNECPEQEVRDLQDILIEDYNRKLTK